MRFKTLLAVSTATATALLVSVVIAGGGSSSSLPANLTGVRAEYVELSSGHDTYSTCHLINTSLTTAITIRSVLVLGPGGREDVIASYDGLSGHTLRPLCELRLKIDTSIPGVNVQTAEGGHGVRNVIVGWDGPQDALNLTALIERFRPAQDGQRTHVISEGYRIW